MCTDKMTGTDMCFLFCRRFLSQMFKNLTYNLIYLTVRLSTSVRMSLRSLNNFVQYMYVPFFYFHRENLMLHKQ